MYSIYIIFSSSSNIYYKGFTEDLEKRLLDHNSNKSRYTANKGPWELVYSESYATKREALIREKQIKRWNRKTILAVIEQKKI